MGSLSEAREKISPEEAIALGAKDSIFYSQTFFPKTCRQKSPQIHKQMWDLLEGPQNELINLLSFRGSAKTTLIRLLASKLISYRVVNTILWLSKSEPHSIRSLDWLRQQIEYNREWANCFQLKKGMKWQGTEAEIRHDLFKESIWVVALGIEGSVRGLNLGDRRPDLIILDDVIAEDNSATADTRAKIEDLILGSVLGSLAPKSENPFARVINIATPQHREDFSMKWLNDSGVKALKISCWTPETEDLSIEDRVSSWPERFPTKDLIEKRKRYIERGKSHIWAREMECRIVSADTVAFRFAPKFYTGLPPREEMVVQMAIDPVPPPTERQLAKGLRDKDYEAFAVCGKWKNQYFLLEYRQNRGHDPTWTAATFLELCLKWNPQKIFCEAIGYQSTLLWLLRNAMNNFGRYWVLEATPSEFSRKNKYDKILDPLAGPLAEGMFFCHESHQEFLMALADYPSVSFDDLLEAVATVVWGLTNVYSSQEDFLEENFNFAPRLLAP